jgi:poly-gamma-glutamate capsule biosynthesis protein CapA/YwtB (metallophosphatase superfamily)
VRTRRRTRFGPFELVLVIAATALMASAVLAFTANRMLHRNPGSAVAASPSTSPRPTPGPSPSPSPVKPAALTLASIFGPAPDLSRIAVSRKVSMVVTGDIIPARNTNEQMLKRGDFKWPFEATADYLHSGDIEFINLEAPLFATCKPTPTGMSFCGDPRFIDGLAFAGVNVANLSNNHLTNFGPVGTDSTEKLLADHQIQPTGLGLTATMTVKGVRFAFLGFNGVGVAINRAELQREIALARPQADVVVVQFHWGKEYVLTPQSTHDSIAPDDPREIGHLAIDDGADLVIGNHPHAVQGVEVYKDKLITYAHGNFVFDQMWTPDPGQEDPRNGVVGKYTFVDGKLAAVEYKPIRIYEYGQPRFVTGPYADYVTSLMKTSTDLIAAGTTASPPSPPVPAPG